MKVGWGHGTIEYAVAVAKAAGVGQLALTHHDPLRDDAAIDELIQSVRAKHAGDGGPHIFAAAEGQVIELSARNFAATARFGFPAQAPMAPALVGRSALLAMATSSRAAELAWLMRAACRWVRAPQPTDEDRRLAATRALGLWKTPPEERFDRVTRLASALFDVPIALIALMERDREWFKSSFGLEIREVLRDDSFCSHAIFERRPLVVVDALLDERFADNPYVTGPPGVRFYAGHPLILGNACCVGTLCILDTKPRHLDDAALRLLGDLAQFAVREMDSKVALSVPE